MTQKIKNNDVFHFIPKDNSEFANWTRENLFVAKIGEDGKIILVDTYCGIGRLDNKQYSLSEARKLGKLEYYCNLDEIEKIEEYKTKYYDDKDIFILHDQHACADSCIYYFVRKGAEKDKEKMLETVNELLNKAKREIEYQTRNVEEYSAKKQQIENGNLEIYI